MTLIFSYSKDVDGSRFTSQMSSCVLASNVSHDLALLLQALPHTQPTLSSNHSTLLYLTDSICAPPCLYSHLWPFHRNTPALTPAALEIKMLFVI